MKKKRKKFNQFKQLSKFADYLLRDILVVYTTRHGGCVLLDYKRMELVQPSDKLAAAVNFPHVWSCYLAAFGRTGLGEEYMKSEQIITQAKHRQADLAEVFESYHRDLIQRIPEHQRVGVGWIASPQGAEINEQQAGEIFTRLNAWDERPEEDVA